MNQEQINLEHVLTEMTTWRGEPPQQPLWETALAENEQTPQTAGILKRALFCRTPTALAASILLLIGIATILTIGLNQTKGRVTSSASMAARSEANTKQLGGGVTLYGAEWSDRQPTYRNDNLRRYGSHQEDGATLNVAGADAIEVNDLLATSQDGSGGGLRRDPKAPPAAESADRQVVRKATVELEAADVRSAFLKAGMLISEAGGEYIEQSSLIGEKESAQANLTLRVAAERMHAVLTALHDLAHVRSETQGGEDVTAAIVDLDARLRNEQRVEKELLELLDKRTDAPLNDILQLRTEIARVRQTIEQIAGQQQRLSRLVSLATILVIIRPPQPEPKTPETQPAAEKPSLSKYFGESFKDSWSGGMHFLADTLAGLMGVLVGGAIWWIALIVSLLVLRQHLRRKAGLA